MKTAAATGCFQSNRSDVASLDLDNNTGSAGPLIVAFSDARKLATRLVASSLGTVVSSVLATPWSDARGAGSGVDALKTTKTAAAPAATAAAAARANANADADATTSPSSDRAASEGSSEGSGDSNATEKENANARGGGGGGGARRGTDEGSRDGDDEGGEGGQRRGERRPRNGQLERGGGGADEKKEKEKSARPPRKEQAFVGEASDFPTLAAEDANAPAAAKPAGAWGGGGAAWRGG